MCAYTNNDYFIYCEASGDGSRTGCGTDSPLDNTDSSLDDTDSSLDDTDSSLDNTDSTDDYSTDND